MSSTIADRVEAMALKVEVQRATAATGLPSTAQLTAWARAAWQAPRRAGEVVVRLTDVDESRRLNHDYRGKDRPTNVLSFPFEPPPQVEMTHVGDLVLCAPVIAEEAHEQGKSTEAHWAHMVVHGMLHLQGHDHESDAQAAAMERLETEILTGLGYPAPYMDDETKT